MSRRGALDSDDDGGDSDGRGGAGSNARSRGVRRVERDVGAQALLTRSMALMNVNRAKLQKKKQQRKHIVTRVLAPLVAIMLVYVCYWLWRSSSHYTPFCCGRGETAPALRPSFQSIGPRLIQLICRCPDDSLPLS
jgi:hypothetical protein